MWMSIGYLQPFPNHTQDSLLYPWRQRVYIAHSKDIHFTLFEVQNKNHWVCTHTLPRVKVRFLSVIFSLLVRQRFPFDTEMCTLYTNVCQLYIVRDPINPMVWFRGAPACMGSDINCTTSQFFISTLYTFLTTLHSTLGQSPQDLLF